MRCKKCNGELVYSDGIWSCSSCGSKFSLQEYTEDIDVYLCYRETDDSGRRTKDSAIAQEIYSFLESKKIRTFYKRISTDGIVEEESQRIDSVAISNARIVLLIGTSASTFSMLWNDKRDSISDKKIIPVFFDMNANEIPNNIKSIQSLKYDTVGSNIDLLNAISKALGRKQEDLNYETLHKKESGKKNIIIIFVIFIFVIIIVIAFILKQTLVVRENIAPDSSEAESTVSVENMSEEDMYTQAVSYIDTGKYDEAIKLLSNIGDYKDSNTLLRTCYSKYAGYYKDDATGMFFRLQLFENSNGSIELYAINENGEKCTIAESISFEGTYAQTHFTDSENNFGDVEIELQNDGIALELRTTEQNSDVFLSDASAFYLLEQKSDQPIKKMPTIDLIKEILETTTTLGDLERQGYELSYDGNLYKDDGEQYYKFDNTDVSVVAFSYDLQDSVDHDMDYTYERAKVDNPIIYGVVGPADIIAPDKIGEQATPFQDDEYLLLPNGSFDVAVNSGGSFMTRDVALEESSQITESTLIAVCCRKTVGETIWENTKIPLLVYSPISERIMSDTGSSEPIVSIIGEDDEKYTVYGKVSYEAEEGTIYYVQKSDYSISTQNGKVALLDWGNYYVTLGKENSYSSSYINDLYFEGDQLILDGCIRQLTYDGADTGTTVKSSKIIIGINSETKFYYYEGEDDSKNYISREEFQENIINMKESGLGLRFSVDENHAVEFGFYS